MRWSGNYWADFAVLFLRHLEFEQRIGIAGHVGRRRRHAIKEGAAFGVGRERIADREHDAVEAVLAVLSYFFNATRGMPIVSVAALALAAAIC
jgi:hypothetical protein